VFAFGIGAGVNRPMIENLARGGMGEAFIVQDLKDGPKQAARLRAYIDRPVFSHVHARFVGFDAFDLEPQTMPDVLADRPLVLVGKFQGAIGGTIELSGLAGRKPVTLVVDAANAAKVEDSQALRYLWARSRISRLIDETFVTAGYGDGPGPIPDTKQAITDLGLKYSLLTPYTSFVAATDESRTAEQAETVQQPAVARAGSFGGRSSGYGAPIAQERKLDVDLAQQPTLPKPHAAERLVAGKRFVLAVGRWQDADAKAIATTLRVRVDSAAFARLLALDARFAEWARLGDVVLIAFGDLAIELSPQGFGDLPEVSFARVRDALTSRH
jgi:Ca-activated chloride channel family protein